MKWFTNIVSMSVLALSFSTSALANPQEALNRINTLRTQVDGFMTRIASDQIFEENDRLVAIAMTVVQRKIYDATDLIESGIFANNSYPYRNNALNLIAAARRGCTQAAVVVNNPPVGIARESELYSFIGDLDGIRQELLDWW